MGEVPTGAPVDLLWSLWSELGIPGPHRHHRLAISDPERLLVVTPWLARTDDRLCDMVFSWCTQHAERLSGPRRWALVQAATPEVQSAAVSFLAELAGAGVALAGCRPCHSGPVHSAR